MNELNTHDPFRKLRRILRALHTPGMEATPASIQVLCELVHKPQSSIKGLGHQCRKGGKRIQRSIETLKKAGYIECAKIGLKRRDTGATLTITDKGFELLRAMQMAFEEPASRDLAKNQPILKSA